MKQEKVAGMPTWPVEDGVRLRLCQDGSREVIFLAHGGSAFEPNSRVFYEELIKNEVILNRAGVIFGGDAVFQGKEKMVDGMRSSGKTIVAIDAVRRLVRPGTRTCGYANSIDMSWQKIEKIGKKVSIALGDSLGALAIIQTVVERVEQGKMVPDRLILINAPLGGFNQTTLTCAEMVGGDVGMRDLHPNSEYLADLRVRLKNVGNNFPETVVIYGDVGERHVGFALGGVPEFQAKKWGDFATGGDGVVGMGGARLIDNDQPLVRNLTEVKMNGCFHNLTRRMAAPIVAEIMKRGAVMGNKIEPGTSVCVPDSGWLKKYENNCTVAFAALQMILRATNKQ
jgi:hypothetical protein